MIGVLDSGVGGLSILKAIKEQHPDASMLYLSDNKNFPYGDKAKEDLTEIIYSNAKWLIAKGVKILVIACNSATVTAVDCLRTKVEIPIVGMEPAVGPAIRVTKAGQVGIIATARTIANHSSSNSSFGNVRIITKATAELATKIETDLAGISDSYIMSEFDTFKKEGVDTVVLGCSHYHFLYNRLTAIYPSIQFIAPEAPIAKRVSDIIAVNDIKIERGLVVYYASAEPARLRRFLIEQGIDNDPIVRLKK